MSDYQVKIKEGESLNINTEDLSKLDVIENNDGTYHLLYNNKSYNVSILKSSCDNKQIVLSINDKEIELDIKDQLDQMLDKMGFSNNKKQGSGKISSPMPGLVLGIDVKVGQEVEKGDTLLILEAMKMENLIKSPTSGTIKSIDVKKADAVSKNQLLLVIE